MRLLLRSIAFRSRTTRAFSSTVSVLSKMKVVPVLVSADNYAYLIIDEPSKKAAVVDVFNVEKVRAVAEQEGVSIVAGITTHHHHDHSGGNKAYGDKFTIGDNIHVRCLATPCHTKDSICYHVTDSSNKSQSGGVFTGDTLFQGGCGRFFEGTGEQMRASLSKLATLPDDTIVYNGHEYTAGNIAFAKSVEPENPAINRLAKLAQENKVTTGLSTIGDEKEWNVFMRLDKAAIKQATGEEEPSAVMTKLRELKNNFRG
ncbi:beta-lactamase-like protein [Suillus paluster]|uniref:beta-lactamase-like protein n=1 Tax=Suillus paluster TaxID=48578 RepID=UPI001B865837|nr:beta-lactamase-like protein [Suillus paluster]KAG1749031.1 beta-lactamase-like protein [Suillus paluster]